MSPSTWRLADLFAKHAFLCNGLGSGSMPLHTVDNDSAAGRLVKLSVEDVPPEGPMLPMSPSIGRHPRPGPPAAV